MAGVPEGNVPKGNELQVCMERDLLTERPEIARSRRQKIDLRYNPVHRKCPQVNRIWRVML